MNIRGVLLLKPFRSLIQAIAYPLDKFRREKLHKKYSKKLLISGNRLNLQPVEVGALKYLSAMAGIFIGIYMVVLTKVNIMVVIVLGGLAYFYPDIWLLETIKKRKRRLFEDLPFFMDLLTLSVEAGMSFRGAIENVVEKGVGGPLREELEKMSQDLRLGLVRREALLALSERTDLYAIRSFTTALIQADKLGTPIVHALKVQSDLRRTERFNRLEKLAQETPIKMLGPLLLCIFPAVFIIILGPMWLKFLAEGM
jgi:tight adherence protein C